MVRIQTVLGSMVVVLGTTILAMDEAPSTPKRAAVASAGLTLSASPRARAVMQKTPDGRYTSWTRETEVVEWFRIRPRLAKYALRAGEFDIALEAGLLNKYQQAVIDIHSLFQVEGIRDFGEFESELESLREQIVRHGERQRLTIQVPDDAPEEESGCCCG